MPDRMIKESVCSSEKVDHLSAFEETVFFRLILNVDDNGRIDARSSFLRSKLFLTKQGITIANIENAVHKMASIGLVEIYEVNDKPFLMFPKWHEHQKIRYIKDLYPAPPENTVSENSRKFPQISETFGKLPLEEKRSRREVEVEVEDISAEQTSCSTPIESLPLNNGDYWHVTQEMFDEWVRLYPAVDVLQELRKMVGWLDSNPKRKKTAKGIKSFCNSWLARTQDRGRPAIKAVNTINKDYSTSQDAKRAELIKQFRERQA